MKQEGLFLFNFGDAGQAKLATIAKVSPNLDHQDGVYFRPCLAMKS